MDIKIYDMGTEANDRYTVILLDAHYERTDTYEYVGMNEIPFSPNMGICMHGECKLGDHLGQEITFKDLPEDCQKVLKNYKYV